MSVGYSCMRQSDEGWNFPHTQIQSESGELEYSCTQIQMSPSGSEGDPECDFSVTPRQPDSSVEDDNANCSHHDRQRAAMIVKV